MKNVILTFLFLFTIVLGARGETVKKIALRISQDSFNISEVEGKIKIEPISEKYHFFIEDALPYMAVNVLIGSQDEYNSATIDGKDILIKEKVELLPVKKLPTKFNTEEDVIFDKKSSIGTFQYKGTYNIGRYRYISFLVCPFKYDIKNKKLYIKNNIDINISLKKRTSNNVETQSVYEPLYNESYKNLISDIVINPEDIASLYQQSDKQYRVSRKNNLVPTEYLILTTETLKPVFERLAKWKKLKGFMSDIITIEDIAQKYDADRIELKIKKALYDSYINQGTKYVLLGGDFEQIPSLICFFGSYSYKKEDPQTKKEYWVTDSVSGPSDMYYACFDGTFNWNLDNDNLYGEERGDKVNLQPNIILTRASVSTTDEAKVFVNKILEYEGYPKTDNWKDNILMCVNENPEMGFTGAARYCEQLYNLNIAPYWNGKRFRMFCQTTDHLEDANYDFNASNLLKELSNGYTFVDIFCHGGTSYYGWLEHWEKLFNTEVYSLKNSGYSIINAHSCYSNAFDQDELCMSEAFMRNPQSNVVAYLGYTREGWYPYGFHYGSCFYKSLFTSSSKRFGEAYYKMKILTKNYHHWSSEALNAMGDPEMPVFVDKPKMINDFQIRYDKGNLSIATGGNNSQVCISNEGKEANEVYEVVSSKGNTIKYSSIPNDVYVCITRDGFIPNLNRLGDELYIQNELFDNALNIYAKKVHIGSNITDSKDKGNVVIDRGVIKVNVSEEFIIKNDFEITKGAVFEIITNDKKGGLYEN